MLLTLLFGTGEYPSETEKMLANLDITRAVGVIASNVDFHTSKIRQATCEDNEQLLIGEPESVHLVGSIPSLQ